MFNSATVYLLLFGAVLVDLMWNTEACSPPKTKKPDGSLKQLSFVKRAKKASIIVIGTVIAMAENRFRNAIKASVAVHVQVKSKRAIPRVINVYGFKKDSETFGAFFTTAHLDCTDTSVDLYASYVFFLKSNAYKEYYAQEVDLQSAVTQISCNNYLNSKIKRLLRMVRKSNVTASVRCYANEKSKMLQGGRCLRKKTVMSLLNTFKYGIGNPRPIYCNATANNQPKKKTVLLNNYRKQKLFDRSENGLFRKKDLYNGIATPKSTAADAEPSKSKKFYNSVKRHGHPNPIFIFSETKRTPTRKSERYRFKLTSDWRHADNVSNANSSATLALYLRNLLCCICVYVITTRRVL